MAPAQPYPYPLVGIGLGPANLALAVAVEDHVDATTVNLRNSLFLERNPRLDWHADSLVDDARTTTPFLKDLVTQCNPRSRFTFLNFLKESGRLESFINLHQFFPMRFEFQEYFRWVAERLRDLIRFSVEVIAIHPVLEKTGVDRLAIRIRDVSGGRESTITAHNVSVGLGMTPRLIGGVDGQSLRVIHSSRFLSGMHEAFGATTPRTLLVVGGGQSGAEVVHHLLRSYPDTELHVVSRGFLYRSIDANPFINDLYTDSAALAFAQMPVRLRDLMRSDLNNTNYGVAEGDLVREIYRTLYDERTSGKCRTTFHSYTTVTHIEESNERVHVRVLDARGEARMLAADGVLLATGFEDENMRRLLSPLEPYVVAGEERQVQVDLDYRVMTDPAFRAGVYLQGYGVRSHGFTEGTLTNVGPRARRVINGIIEQYEHPRTGTARWP